MFDMFKKIFETMQQGVGTGNTEAAAAQLAQLGDPDALMAPLFQDTKQWSPTYMGEGLQAPQLAPGNLAASGPLLSFENMLSPGGQPKIDLANSSQFTNGAARPGAEAFGANEAARQQEQQQRSALTALQAKELLGQMPGMDKGYVPPAPPLGRVTPFSGNMAQLQAGPMNATKRPTLAELIYGAR